MADQGNEFIAKTFLDQNKFNLADYNAVENYFEKLSGQLSGHDKFNSDLFQRWERQHALTHSKKAILTQELTDKEYKNIFSQRVIQGQNPLTINETLALRRSEELKQLEEWFSYLLVGDGATHYPEKWFRYYVLYQVLTKDKNGKTRRPTTAMHFADLHQGALSQIHEELTKFTTSEEIENKQDRFEKFQQYKFHERYNYFVEEAERRRNEGGKEKDGWKEFTDPKELAEVSAATPWCLSTLSVAKAYLDSKGSKMHVLFKNGKAEVGVYEKNGEIHEVRGADDRNQNVDPQYTNDLQQKLRQFPNAENYQKQIADSQMLASIEMKTEQNLELTRGELVFLYEINSSIEGFGNGTNLRVAKLKDSRKLFSRSDAQIIFEQIASNEEEINEKTRAYVGPLFPGIFNKLQVDIPIYTSFPEREIKREKISIGGRTKDVLKSKLKQISRITPDALVMMNNEEFTTEQNRRAINLVRLKVEDLGILEPGRPTVSQMYSRAEELGLNLCPAEVGPHFRLIYKEKSDNHRINIAMKQLPGSGGMLSVFSLSRDFDGHVLAGAWYGPQQHISSDLEFVFLAPDLT